MSGQPRPESPGDSTPIQMSGAVRMAAALVIALIALGITVLALRWIPAAADAWPK